MPMFKFGVSSTGRIIRAAEVKESCVCLKCGSFVKAAQIDPEDVKKCPLCGEEGLTAEAPEDKPEAEKTER